MKKRLQKAAAWALGILTAVLAVCVVVRYLPADAGGAPALEPAALPVQTSYGIIDLNRATAEELDALPGIGEVLAERIIACREENGAFSSKEDVLAVPGIGEATYEKIAPYITF